MNRINFEVRLAFSTRLLHTLIRFLQVIVVAKMLCLRRPSSDRLLCSLKYTFQLLHFISSFQACVADKHETDTKTTQSQNNCLWVTIVGLESTTLGAEEEEILQYTYYKLHGT